MEILGYCIIKWLGGKLPWENDLKNCKYVMESKIKYMNDIGNLMTDSLGSNYPEKILKYFNYIKTLQYDSIPDYEKIMSFFFFKKHKKNFFIDMDSDSRNGFILLNYEKVKVIIVLANNYVNITKLCKPMGKSFHNWWNLKSSYQIICNIAKEEDIEVENLSFNVWKGQETKEVYGKYIHPKLLVYILNWISEEYCAKILSIINEFNSKILNNITTNTKINKIYMRLPKEESMFNAIFNKENSKFKNYKKFLINIPTILSKYEKYFLESEEKECAVCLEKVYDKNMIACTLEYYLIVIMSFV